MTAFTRVIRAIGMSVSVLIFGAFIFRVHSITDCASLCSRSGATPDESYQVVVSDIMAFFESSWGLVFVLALASWGVVELRLNIQKQQPTFACLFAILAVVLLLCCRTMIVSCFC